MSDYQPDMPEHDEDDFAEEYEATSPPRWKRIVKRVLIGVGVTIVLLVFAGVMLFQFGGMWGSADPTMQSQFDSMVASGQAKPVQARFVIPIPGCICHSTDPVQTAQHRAYRMSECSRCHNGGETAREMPLN